MQATGFCKCGCGKRTNKAKQVDDRYGYKIGDYKDFIHNLSKRKNEKERIFEHIVVADSGCWEWQTPSKTKNYINVRFKGKNCTAHRMSWVVFNGPIPNKLHVLHKCDNRICVNPEHLFLGTPTDNMQDMIQKGRKFVMLGEQHKRSKLKDNDVEEIRAYCNQGVMKKILAQKYNVSNGLITMIAKRRIWTHL